MLPKQVFSQSFKGKPQAPTLRAATLPSEPGALWHWEPFHCLWGAKVDFYARPSEMVSWLPDHPLHVGWPHLATAPVPTY